MAQEFKIIAKIVTDDKQAKVKASQTGKDIANNINSSGKGVNVGDSINKQLDKVKKNTFADAIKGKLEDAKKGIQALGVGGDRLSKIGDFFKGGAIAAFAAVAIAAGAALKKMWDDAHQSAEQYYNRMQKNQQFLDKAISKSEQENKNTQQWFDRLQEINNQEKISNANKAQAAMLLQLLTKKYGELGIAVDKDTGKMRGLYEAQLKILDLQYQNELRLREKKVEGYTGKGGTAHRAASAVTGKIGVVEVGIDGTTTDTEIDRRKHAERSDAQNMGLDVKMRQDKERVSRHTAQNGFVTYTTSYASDQQIEANKAWNNGGLQGKLKWVQFMRNNKDYTGNADFQAALDNLEKQILEAIVAEDQKTAYKNLNKPSQQAYFQGVASRGRKISEEQKRAEMQRKTAEQRRRSQKQQFEYSGLDTASKIKWQENKKSKAQTEIAEMSETVAELQKAYQASGKKLKQVQEKGDKIAFQKLQKQHIVLLEKLNGQKRKLQKAKDDQQTADIEMKRLQQQLKRQQQTGGGKGSGNYYQNKKQEIQFELQCQKLLLQGKFDQIEKLKIINELKKQGVQIDNQEIQTLIQKSKELKNIKVDQDLKSEALTLYDSLTPKTADSIYQQRIRKYKQQGIELNSDQKDGLKQLIQLQFNSENMPQLDLSKFEIKSNELTRRGGFANGAVVPETDRINTAIMNNTKSQVQILTQVKTLLEKMGWI